MSEADPDELVEHPPIIVYRRDIDRLRRWAMNHRTASGNRIGDSAVALKELLDLAEQKSLSLILNSYRRVEAMAEVNQRKSAVIFAMCEAIERAVAADEIGLLQEALADAQAQLVAADDALNRAFEDLPEDRP